VLLYVCHSDTVAVGNAQDGLSHRLTSVHVRSLANSLVTCRLSVTDLNSQPTSRPDQSCDGLVARDNHGNAPE